MTPIFCENMKEKVKLDWEGESLNQSSELIDHSCPTLGLSFLTTPPPPGLRQRGLEEISEAKSAAYSRVRH